jgi:hypothetical protein
VQPGIELGVVGDYQYATGTQTDTSEFYVLNYSGPVHLCVFVGDAKVAETTFTYPLTPPTPTPTPRPTPPSVLGLCRPFPHRRAVRPTTLAPGPAGDRAPVDHSALIPSWIGRRNPYRIALNAADVPDGVDPSRFASVARRSARRWGLEISGTTWRTPEPDGYLVLGFAWDLPPDVLGRETRWFKRARTCRTHRHRSGRRHRHCVTRERLVDNDVAISGDLNWQDGPQYPGADQFDLESVVLHELGHYADNGHRTGCVNSPMVDRAGTGEWWRAPTDWFRAGCRAVASSAQRHDHRQADRARFEVVKRYVPDSWRSR